MRHFTLQEIPSPPSGVTQENEMKNCSQCGHSFPTSQVTDVYEIDATDELVTKVMCDKCVANYMEGKQGVQFGGSPIKGISPQELSPTITSVVQGQLQASDQAVTKKSENVQQAVPTKSKTYVCPMCNVVVDVPLYFADKKSIPRCFHGHTLRQVESFWQALATATIAMLIFVPIYLWITGFLSPVLGPIMGAFRIGVLLLPVFGLVEIIKGIGYSMKPEPTKRLAPGASGMGLGFLLGSAVLFGIFLLTHG